MKRKILLKMISQEGDKIFKRVILSRREDCLFADPKNRERYAGLVEVGRGERINVTVDDMSKAYGLARRYIREHLDTATQEFVGVDYQFIPQQGETPGVRVILNFRDYMRQ